MTARPHGARCLQIGMTIRRMTTAAAWTAIPESACHMLKASPESGKGRPGRRRISQGTHQHPYGAHRPAVLRLPPEDTAPSSQSYPILPQSAWDRSFGICLVRFLTKEINHSRRRLSCTHLCTRFTKPPLCPQETLFSIP